MWGLLRRKGVWNLLSPEQGTNAETKLWWLYSFKNTYECKQFTHSKIVHTWKLLLITSRNGRTVLIFKLIVRKEDLKKTFERLDFKCEKLNTSGNVSNEKTLVGSVGYLCSRRVLRFCWRNPPTCLGLDCLLWSEDGRSDRRAAEQAAQT